ncbi:MAG: EpsI family protein [Sphingopyxis sp.]|nr:EpsI family protein [Sphingopyxis sp.]
MMDRRDLLFAMGCVAGSGGALWMRPDNHVRLMPPGKMADAVPEAFADWSIDRGMGVVMPPSEGSLADRLYDEILARAYMNTDSMVPPVMCLMTYGARQSDALQLHRPETCYPAVGFTVSNHRKTMLPLAAGALLPVVEITARLGNRIEDVVYWTRVGEDLPQDPGQQRKMRLRSALAGVIGDGVLVRMSSVRRQPDTALHAPLRRFATDLLISSPAPLQRGLIGTQFSAVIARKPRAA